MRRNFIFVDDELSRPTVDGVFFDNGTRRLARGPLSGDELPLQLHLGQAAQPELAEAEHALDDSEHRLHRLLAQLVFGARRGLFELGSSSP